MFEAVFPFDPIPAEEVAELCWGFARTEAQVNAISLYGTQTDLPGLRRAVRTRQHFSLKAGDIQISWGGVRNRNLELLTGEHLSANGEESLLCEVARRAPLIVARSFDADYELWQNAEQPSQFAAAGRSTELLPMKNNGLPPPLNAMIVDISQNPGRRVFRNGYVEAVAHRMWLGPEFFKRVPGASEEAVLSAAWLKIIKRPNSVLELVAHTEPFREGLAVDVQNRLRALLFPKDVTGGVR